MEVLHEIVETEDDNTFVLLTGGKVHWIGKQ